MTTASEKDKNSFIRAIELGCLFSVNEYMLNSSNGRSIVQKIPVDRLLLESDAPFISDIRTVDQLKRSLTHCLNELNLIKGNEVWRRIFETNRKLFEIGC